MTDLAMSTSGTTRLHAVLGDPVTQVRVPALMNQLSIYGPTTTSPRDVG